MSVTSTTNTLIEFFNELDTANGYDVYVPSLCKDVKFKQLTTEQLKSLLKTAVGSPIYNTDFTLAFNKIIRENCLEQDINTGLLNVYDKLFILFKTKIECLSPDYTFYFTDNEINEYNLNDSSSTISLLEHFNNFKQKNITINNKIIESNGVVVECVLPTLDVEDKFEKELHSNITHDDISTNELQEIIGETFINELSKFINSITVNGTKYDLNSETFTNRVKIVEKIPVSIVNGVIKYIEEYKNITKDLLMYSFKTDSGILFEKEISLDATLFNI